MGPGRQYATIIIVGVLAVCLFVLGARWYTLGQREPLQLAPTPTAASASTAADTRSDTPPAEPEVTRLADLPPKQPDLIDINSASATELSRLPGIGEVLAGRIIDYRESHGPFKTVEGLLSVQGIGDKKLAALRDHACCGNGEDAD